MSIKVHATAIVEEGTRIDIGTSIRRHALREGAGVRVDCPECGTVLELP